MHLTRLVLVVGVKMKEYSTSTGSRSFALLDFKLEPFVPHVELEQGQASGAVVAPYLRPFCTIE